MDYENSPRYLTAADLHNVGAGTTSFFDSPGEYLGEKIGGVAESIGNSPKFAITSIASGINSIYNSGVVAGNWLGVTDAQENDIQQTLGSYDANLADYYGENKQAADLTGFIVTSFIPGIGGAKLFNVGQKALSGTIKSGTAGRTFAEATGLIPTLTAEGKTLTQVAGEALAQGQQTFTLMNAGVLKAIGQGAAQATWESAAAEVMIAGTMFRSPILENQDFGDIAANMLLGAGVGGVIGGAFNAAGVYKGIRKEITAQDLADKLYTLRSSQANLNSPADKIVVALGDLEATPANPVGPREVALRDARINSIKLEVRENIHALAKGDREIGSVVADSLEGLDSNQMARALSGAVEISRPGYEFSKAAYKAEGKEIGYVRIHGEGVGNVTFDPVKKPMLTLADKLTGGKEAILGYVKSAKWTEAKPWVMATAKNADEIEARYIWAEKFAKYKDGMVIHASDIPLQEGALRAGIKNVTIDDGVHSYTISNLDDLKNTVIQNKRELANELTLAKNHAWIQEERVITSEEIARATNVSPKFLESTETASAFARQDAQTAYSEMVKAKGLKGETDISFIPQNVAVIYDTAGVVANGDLTSALVNIKQTQHVAQEAIDKSVASAVGDELFERMYHPGDKAMIQSNRYGAGAGLVKFSNGSYGSLASWAETMGRVTSDITDKFNKNTSAILESVTLRLRNDQVSAIKFSKINDIISSTTEKYVVSEAGDGLIPRKLAEYNAKVKASGKKGLEVPTLQEGAPDFIPFDNDLVREAVEARIASNGYRVGKSKALRNSQGMSNEVDENTFYPLKPQPKDFPFFAFVKDETVTGAAVGHTTMIHAASEAELDGLIKMAREKTGFTVYTKADAENFYKSQQSYEFGRTLHENYIDSSLKSKGVNSAFFPKTDPSKIVDSWLELERRADSVLARDVVSTKFGNEFDQLETLGQQYTNVASSRYGVTAKAVESTAQNPYNDYRKTVLNISRMGEYPLLTAFNRNLEQGVSRVYQKIVDTWNEGKGINDLDKVNDALQAAGVNHAYKNAAEVMLANHTAPQPYVSKFIRGANAILANTFLRLDPLNALNNAIGSQVLLGHETTQLLKAIRNGNSEVAGELAGLMNISVPGGAGASIPSAAKLIGNANANWYRSRTDAAFKEYYKRNGWMTTISEQQHAMIDDLTLSGTESSGKLSEKLDSALKRAKELTDKGEKITGNRMAEEYNRFVAANVADQITQIGIKAGVLDADSARSYINTFVNRTQGNIMASQRPLIFQGPIGQAVGLFQGFQFNTIQQLFRAVSEGSAKDAAMLMGLQGTLYGLNGLPGFQYINQHIIGTASGNTEHKDLYSATYGALGKETGDWLMYGIPSNMLQTNLYTRGDINPRSVTVIPTNPSDVIAVSAFSKFAGNILETSKKMANGGDFWQSFLQGVEHNGLSRPLTGLAQTLQAAETGKVFSTTNSGDLSFVNDFFSLATLSRLAGGKPLDEALANDEVARTMVYKAADRAKMKAATEKFKSHITGTPNEILDPEIITGYMEAYVNSGGRAEDFNKTMLNSLTKANTPKANQVINTLKGPYAEHMKLMMGGSVQELE